MTKEIYPYAGRLEVNVIVRSQRAESFEKGYASSNNMSFYFDDVLRRAIMNAVGFHIETYYGEKLNDYSNSGVTIVINRVMSYEIIDWDIEYYGDLDVKRVNRKGKYYNQVRVKGKIIKTDKWSSKKQDLNDVSVEFVDPDADD